MTTSLRITAVIAALLAGTGSLRAEITVTRAEYAGGALVVRGETSRPDQQVTLDGRYKTRTNRYKEFRFRIRYLPSDCGITIRAGQETRPARVVNCEMIGVTPKSGTSPKSDANLSTQTSQTAAPVAWPQVVPLTAESMYRGWRVSQVLGRRAMSKSGEELGTVRNIMMGLDGQIVALIVEGASSNSRPEFVYRIPWSTFQSHQFPSRVIANALPGSGSQHEHGLLSTKDPTNEFAVTSVIGDYARLQAGQMYGYVNDVVFSNGRMLAVLVTRDFAAGGGTYAFGFPGTIGRWNPAAGYYGLPYVTAQKANGAAVKVNPKRFADPA